jgi:cytochrome P450
VWSAGDVLEEEQPAARKDHGAADRVTARVTEREQAIEQCRAERTGQVRPSLAPIEAGTAQGTPLGAERRHVDPELPGPGVARGREGDRVIARAHEPPRAQAFEKSDPAFAGKVVVTDPCRTQAFIPRTGDEATPGSGGDAHQSFEHGRDLAAGNSKVAVPALPGQRDEPAFGEASEVAARRRGGDAGFERKLGGGQGPTAHEGGEHTGARAIPDERGHGRNVRRIHASMVTEACPPEARYPGGMSGPQRSAPRDPVAAVTHPDPYPYYARLVAESPLYWDEGRALWVASSAALVTAVLTHPASRVRPADEPVPRVLLGSPAADIFRHLVRMNDGGAHCPFKHAVTVTLDGIDRPWLETIADLWAGRLAARMGPKSDPVLLTELAFALPVYVVGSLLGLPEESLGEVAVGTSELVRCVFPGGSPDEIERGKDAAGRLLDLVGREIASAIDRHPLSLLPRLTGHARRVGRDDAGLVAANAIGFLVQAYDATAALISTALLTLAREPALLAQIERSPDALATAIDEVLRYDAPVQNTRRFLHEAADIGGRRLPAGSAILVVLAAANRDPQVNPRPDVIDLARSAPEVFTFGIGPHACPGRRVTTSIAHAAVARLLANGIDPRRIDTRATYRPSANCRMPLLTGKEIS